MKIIKTLATRYEIHKRWLVCKEHGVVEEERVNNLHDRRVQIV